MIIKNNPFTSNTFIDKWCKHYNKKSYQFECIKNLNFYKSSYFSLYINIGKTFTKGLSYSLNQDLKTYNIKRKVFLIYDVPQYFKIENNISPKQLKLIKIKQYPGYITNLKNYKDYNEYIASNFSKKSRYKFKSYKRTLENTFNNISYKHFYGETNRNEYNIIFDQFNNLLKKRFEQKLETNNNLNSKEWSFYKELVYPLILKKQASLYVIYENSTPIAISLNYFSKNILFYAITGFDIDYSKYNVGKVHLMELINWCFEQKIEIFDFSKGYYDYKKRWGDMKYDFENHIYYNPKSLSSIIIAHSTANLFKLKQFLRNKNINKKISKLFYYIKNKRSSTTIS